ncbi:DUF6356 family protein [Phenylobacterium aquaticum]|uniref:DUF6356 family protein n=1 Tax=Phenylobacterium aquaticum TaxID=1763816 RepID=UPI001F5C6606|nr:DUF6356 family protein [Phenylobacterium aquaticum]MCI3132457.1 DUF6356 family protein [Phenylobacterium aquaticum]
MIDAFTRHPHAVGETYGEHLSAASSYAWPMIAAGFACLIHAIFPFAFERTASDCVQRLYGRMAARGRVPAHGPARDAVNA